MKRTIYFFLGCLAFMYSVTASSEDLFSYGAWKQVSSEYDAAGLSKEYNFAVFKEKQKIGTTLKFYDNKKHKLLCCLVINSEPVTEAGLRVGYKVPEPWITDMVNARGNAKGILIYQVLIEGTATQKALEDFDYDGFLIDDKAELGKVKGTIIFGKKTYRVKKTEWQLPDYDGLGRKYMISDISEAVPHEKPRYIFITFSTN